MSNKDVWAEAAYDILVEVAGRYHAVIEYSELGEEIQRRSGVTTRMAIRNWIGGVLEIVVHRCARNRIPALTALVVRKNTGMVGDGYDAVLRAEGIPPLEDAMQRENHAAQARLQCYRWARASDLPPDGGVPALAPKLAATVERQRKAQAPRPARVCLRCNMAIPATGACDNCD
ncbi:hypothetical protein [Nocardioides sediminis]|uniref:hypothetical protein n=1 Tax=Nocardioides sediminis TaxID=433648 RepID=UPI000D2FA751|nr:hypothetical protein [Nocardioides sediminis]